VVGTGNGEEAAGKGEYQRMEVNSASLIQSDSKNTGRTSKLTAEQSLEILQQALWNCKQLGIEVRASQFYNRDYVRSVMVELVGVEFEQGNLRMINHG